MNAIMGFSQLLKTDTDRPLLDYQLEHVDEILKASEHLLELINQVLDLAKIEAGGIDLSIEELRLGEAVIESLQLIRPLADKQDIEITLKLNGEDIYPQELVKQRISISADHTRFKQVLLNLLSNAIKYNKKKGQIIINCYPLDKDFTRISISDSGKGLSQDQQAHLFEAFNRLGAESSGIEGNGIGLIISKNIVEYMGGDIGVTSEPGQGSTFWVDMPSIHTNMDDHSTQDQSSNEEKSALLKNSEQSILYIEDNPANLRLINKFLNSRRPGIHLWNAHEPNLGIELAEAHEPDLILLDINLPGMNGFEVLNHLQQNETLHKVPVVAISANAMPNDIKKALDAGFDDYITKPVNLSSLLHIVDDKLSGKAI